MDSGASTNYLYIGSSIERYERQYKGGTIGNGGVSPRNGKIRIITEGNACWVNSGGSGVTAASDGSGFYMPAEAILDARLVGTHIAVYGVSSAGRIWFTELDEEGY